MISAAERQERLEAVEDVIGTQRAEGIELSAPVLEVMYGYAEGKLTLEEFSAAMNKLAHSRLEQVSVLAHVA